MNAAKQLTKSTIATFLTGCTGILLLPPLVAPAPATQQLFCTGQMNNGWRYTAEFLNGRFELMRWERSGQPPQVTRLTFDRTNPQGQPIYRGGVMGALGVRLVDLSRGDVRQGSRITVQVDDWGQSSGTCGTSSTVSSVIKCIGQMNNGWQFTAEFRKGRFELIRWERSGQPPQVTRLTFDRANPQGQPVYRGSVMGALGVKLVDPSQGDVRSGSKVVVTVDDWGRSSGSCGMPNTGETVNPPPVLNLTSVRANLINRSGGEARDWLKNNGFSFNRTVENLFFRTVERWNLTANQAIDLTLLGNTVVNVVQVQGP